MVDCKVWYGYHSLRVVKANQSDIATIKTPIQESPVLIRGGSIIPRKERLRRSSALMRFDPYTLFVALDKNVSYPVFLLIDRALQAGQSISMMALRMNLKKASTSSPSLRTLMAFFRVLSRTLYRNSLPRLSVL
jgi:alpha-glucosidase (family GH31 glycosyl hydrolase)